jgi:hypothetical protein
LRSKASLRIVLLAWFFASGSQWDVVQVFAWARMIVTNAETMSLGDAIVRTFSPEAPCELCKAVSAAKQKQETPAAPAPKLEEKTFLVVEPVSTFAAAVLLPAGVVLDEARPVSLERDRPPVPPPRSC